jgi:hypothetical protein
VTDLAAPDSAVAAQLRRHRSIRQYTDRPVEPELVRSVCELAVAG